MASALVMFVGGIMIAVFFTSDWPISYRWIVGIFVTFYFILRIGQSVLIIRRNNQKEKGSLHELIHNEED